MAGLTPEPAIQALFGQTPQAAIDWLAQRTPQPSGAWHEVLNNAHNRAFVVAHMAHLDLLRDVQASLIHAMQHGQNFREWQAQIEPVMRSKGWWGKQIVVDGTGNAREVQLGSPSRLQTIYRTNVLQAYEAGRQQVMFAPSSFDVFPYVQYSAVLDNRTRPRHRALHGVVMRKDDPAWSSIRPKNGYNCRCTVIELTAGQVEREKLQVDSSAGYLSEETVEAGRRMDGSPATATVSVLRLPGRPSFQTDPGWNGVPDRPLMPQLLTRAEQAMPMVAARTIERVLANPAALRQLTDDFQAWAQPIVAQVPQPGQPKIPMRLNGSMMHVGVIPSPVVAALEQAGQPLQSAILTVRDDDIVHALRPAKHNPVDRAWYLDLPQHLTQPQAVLLDHQKQERSLLFVYPVAGNDRIKAVVMVDYQVKSRIAGIKQAMTTNIVRTTQIVQDVDLMTKNYQVLIGKV